MKPSKPLHYTEVTSKVLEQRGAPWCDIITDWEAYSNEPPETWGCRMPGTVLWMFGHGLAEGLPLEVITDAAMFDPERALWACGMELARRLPDVFRKVALRRPCDAFDECPEAVLKLGLLPVLAPLCPSNALRFSEHMSDELLVETALGAFPFGALTKPRVADRLPREVKCELLRRWLTLRRDEEPAGWLKEHAFRPGWGKKLAEEHPEWAKWLCEQQKCIFKAFAEDDAEAIRKGAGK